MAAVTPEHLETRIVRLETRGERWDLTVPLLGEVAVMDERVDGIKDDVDQGLTAVRKEFLAAVQRIEKRMDDRDAQDKETAKQRRTDRAALYVGAIGLLGAFLTSLLPLLFGAH